MFTPKTKLASAIRRICYTWQYKVTKEDEAIAKPFHEKQIEIAEANKQGRLS